MAPAPSARASRRASRMVSPPTHTTPKAAPAPAEEAPASQVWEEPPLRPAAPSYEDYKGVDRHAVLEGMLPLGTPPSAKLLAKSKPELFRRTRRRKLEEERSSTADSAWNAATATATATATAVVEEDAGRARRGGRENARRLRSLSPRAMDDEHEGESEPSEVMTGPARSTPALPPNGRSNGTATAATRPDIKAAMDAAIETAGSAGHSCTRAAIKKFYEESLCELDKRQLLEAVLTRRATASQRAAFEDYIKKSRRKIKAARSMVRASPTSDSKSRASGTVAPARSSRTRASSITRGGGGGPSKRRTTDDNNNGALALNTSTSTRSSLTHAGPSATIKPSHFYPALPPSSSSSPSSPLPAKVATDYRTPANNNKRSQQQQHHHQQATHRSQTKRSQQQATHRSRATLSRASSSSSLSSITSLVEAPTLDSNLPAAASTSIMANTTTTKRKRGRPSKRKPSTAGLDEADAGVVAAPSTTTTTTAAAKRPRLSRPRDLQEQQQAPESNVRGSVPASNRASAASAVLGPGAGRKRAAASMAHDDEEAVPAKRAKTARVKNSPVKKKTSVTAGIARSGRASADQLQDDNHDFCQSCGGIGDLLCCDGCPRSFHFTCLDKAVDKDDLPETWYCQHCVAARAPQPPPPPIRSGGGVFGALLDQVERRVPAAFNLPAPVREYFEYVATDADGTYQNDFPTKTRRAGYEEVPDLYRQWDGKGNLITCYKCCKAADPKGKKQIAPCDFCDLYWHLDCLDPPMVKFPGPNVVTGKPRQAWMCPIHVDQLLLRRESAGVQEGRSSIGHGRHKVRRPRNARIVDVPAATVAQGRFRNNGLIEVAFSDSDEEPDDGFFDYQGERVMHRLPAKGIIADFIGKAHRLREQNEAARRQAAAEAAAAEAAPTASTALQEAAEALMQMATMTPALAAPPPPPPPQPQGLEALTNALIAHIQPEGTMDPVEVKPAGASAEPSSSTEATAAAQKPEPGPLSDDERALLQRLQLVIDRRLAAAEGFVRKTTTPVGPSPSPSA